MGWRLCSMNAQTITVISKVDSSNITEPENLNVLHQWLRWNHAGNFLLNHLNHDASILLDAREEVIKKLKGAEEWRNRQRWVRMKLDSILGDLPRAHPLNVQITGIVQKNGYRLEKLIYESFPGVYVPGCLFIPDGLSGKVPAVLNVIGHNQESFRAELYQVIIQNLVKKGMIVLAIDPIGQGEHVQNYDPDVKFSKVGYSVEEHCYVGNQCFLTGNSLARYFVMDAMRAIDVLVARPEVDSDRIGMTGFSGGATVTSYLMALDDRIKAAIPCSWPTASRHQLETKGAQDAEANLLHSFKNGISFEDLLELRAPKATLLTFVTRDEYLSYQGAWAAYQEAKVAFSALGFPEHIQWVEDDSEHWMTPKIREAIYAFFIKHFSLPGHPREESYAVLTPEELQITPNGQVSTFMQGKRIFDLNQIVAQKLYSRLEQQRQQSPRHLSTVLEKAKAISGFIEPGQKREQAMQNGKYQRDGYSIIKYATPGEGDYVIPWLLFVPKQITQTMPVIIYLHDQGKSFEASPNGEIERLLRQGCMVAAIDPLGIGELKSTAGRSITPGYTAVLIGRSVPGLQTGDVLRVVNNLFSRSDVDTTKIGVMGIGRMAVTALHVSAFHERIAFTVLQDMPLSFFSIANHRDIKMGLTARPNGGYWHPYEVDFSWGVPGVLTAYDLPDLMAAQAPKKLWLINPRTHQLELASSEFIQNELAFPTQVYKSKNALSQLKITAGKTNFLEMINWILQ